MSSPTYSERKNFLKGMKNMSIHERVFLSPLEKWQKYKRFPWKFVLHLVLILITTSQILIYNKQNSSYIRAAYRNWKYFFFPSNLVEGKYIYSINETKYAIQNVSAAYYTLNVTSAANYDYILGKDSKPLPVMLDVVRFYNGELNQSRYYLRKDDHRPFSDFPRYGNLVTFVQSLKSMKLTMRLRDRERGPFYSDCFDWRIVLVVEKVESSQFMMSLDDVGVKDCRVNSFKMAIQSRFMWLNLLIIGLAITYLFLCIKSIVRSMKLYFKVRSLNKRTLGFKVWQSWLALPLATKARFFSSWFLLSAISLLCCIVSSIWNITGVVSHIPLSYGHNLVQAIGCSLLWGSFVGFLEHNKRFYSVILTLRHGMPQVIRFLVGVFPLIVGYALFGMTYFGSRVDCFGDFSSSLLTLFAVMNGDAILDTFALLSNSYPFLGQVYLYTFITLFMYIVLNVAIAIVEDAYFTTLRYRRAMEKFMEMSRDNTLDESNQTSNLTFLQLLDALDEVENRDQRTQ